jgi:hypothetical protein
MLKRSAHIIACLVCSAFLLVTATSASAQPMQAGGMDVSLGYQILHVPDETYPFGWNLDVSAPLNDVWRIVGELGMSRDEQTEVGVSGKLKYWHFGAGPRIAADQGAVRPFVQVLGGVAHPRADLVLANFAEVHDADWAFMLQPGAGVAVPIGAVVSVIGQADYRRVFFREQGDNEYRVSFGVRFGF